MCNSTHSPIWTVFNSRFVQMFQAHFSKQKKDTMIVLENATIRQLMNKRKIFSLSLIPTFLEISQIWTLVHFRKSNQLEILQIFDIFEGLCTSTQQISIIFSSKLFQFHVHNFEMLKKKIKKKTKKPKARFEYEIRLYQWNFHKLFTCLIICLFVMYMFFFLKKFSIPFCFQIELGVEFNSIHLVSFCLTHSTEFGLFWNHFFLDLQRKKKIILLFFKTQKLRNLKWNCMWFEKISYFSPTSFEFGYFCFVFNFFQQGWNLNEDFRTEKTNNGKRMLWNSKIW